MIILQQMNWTRSLFSHQCVCAIDGKTMRGNLRQTSIPDASARSGLSSPTGPTLSLQLNRFTRLASANLDKTKENPIPGQSLLPAPNGTNLESVR